MNKFGHPISDVTSGMCAGDWVTRYVFQFENGYGATVIRGKHTYGGKEGLWELAVWHNGAICYDTPITPSQDVEGWLDEKNVELLLDRIKELPKVGEAS